MPTFAGFLRNFSPWMIVTLLSLCFLPYSYADDASATLSLAIADTSGAVIQGATIVIRNVSTNQEQRASSGKDGNTTFSFLKPGQYVLVVSKQSFSDVAVDNINLNVGDEKHLQLVLKVGSAEQTVTVDGSGLTINTIDGSVSTVIDRRFVENTPLNGRSFQSLILLTPGSVTTTPQRGSSLGSTGEFSINGQRTESNYYTVDGVSAISGVSANLGTIGGSGSLPASTALGGTQALVSVDALQEFRVESSTYSAEYGRSPGGQFSMVTRSGTNDWHGTVFDYFRNEALDANDWFNDNTIPATRKPSERQNDFGGVLGGPIRIPHLYNGQNKSFFFFSYEGLRLEQPTAAGINVVPDLALRQSTTGPLQQALNAFPLPTPNAPDLGNGLGEFTGSWSNPSQADSTSVRFDQSIGGRIHVFFRFSNTPSHADTRGTGSNYTSPSQIASTTYLSRSYTLGTTIQVNPKIANDFRLNFSSNGYTGTSTLDGIGGAVPVDLNNLQGLTEAASTTLFLDFPGYLNAISTATSSGKQGQWDLVNTLNVERGRHAIKVGADWRRLAPTIQQASPDVFSYFTNAASVTVNTIDIGYGITSLPDYPVYTNVSVFAQDTWRAGSRLTVSPGIRWDVNPPPGVSRGSMPYAISGLNDYSTMTLAPQSTPLWHTDWFGLAPRLGVAYVVHPDPDRLTVIRGGGGVFFDTGQQTGSSAYQGPGFSATSLFGSLLGTPASFPAPTALISPAIPQPPTPPYGTVYANPLHFQLPYTFEWNASLEQAFGRSQSFTISYVGANGRKLLEEDQINAAAYNPQFTTLILFKNGLTSSYNALQVKYQRQVARGLQALASYTWSHSLDYGSYNTVYPYQRGNSDFDVRNNVTGALSYDLGSSSHLFSRLRWMTSNWGIDGRFTARSGFPVTLDGDSYVDPSTNQSYYGGLNLVPNVPLYLYGSRSTYPGGRRINPAAFILPASGQFGNAPRNFVRGLGEAQADVAIRRSFPIHDRFQAQFRAESFNVSNHPNFGEVNALYGNTQFGEATASLAQSLGTLSPLYQMGGPRSLQLTLKLTY
jgi:hypothetical protein